MSTTSTGEEPEWWNDQQSAAVRLTMIYGMELQHIPPMGRTGVAAKNARQLGRIEEVTEWI